MPTARIITDELIRSAAPNPAAVSNAKKICSLGEFSNLRKTADETLIFGECRGSGKNPYNTSADFSEETPVFRCSCPSRQFPCKHSLALMIEWLSGKNFETSDIPEDIAQKREKAAKRAERSTVQTTSPKQNKSAAEKKLRKQLEGLDLAESFVKDMLGRGVYSVSSAAADQYRALAKQLGDYWLPGLQSIMNQIVDSVQYLIGDPSDISMRNITSLLIKLASTVKKSRQYINSKLESGDVLPENNILYEELGGVWKLTQLHDAGLFKENAVLMQLSFYEVSSYDLNVGTDLGYWLDLETGEIYCTKNIRPLKAAKHIKQEDSANGVYQIPTLYRYPGGMNPRVRWESAEISDADQNAYKLIIERAGTSISEAVKAAKNELKNTLSEPYVGVLLKLDEIELADDRRAVLKLGNESITLRAYYRRFPNTCDVLAVTDSRRLRNGAIFGLLHYIPQEHHILLCPMSLIHPDGITKLC